MADGLIQVRWRSPSGAAIEHCSIKETGAGVTLEGVAVPGDPLAPALRYRIVADAEWAGLRSVHLTIVGGPTLALRHDGYGGWTDGEGKARKDLQGVADVWLAESPVPLMILLKRLGGKAGKTAKVDLAVADPAAMAVARGAAEVACVEAGRAWMVSIAGGVAEAVRFAEDGFLGAWGDRWLRQEPAAAL